MVYCPTAFQDPFRCPTKEEYLVAYLALLPRGRAWQSHEASTSANVERYPETSAECGQAQCGAMQAGQPGLVVTRTVLARYFAAHSELLEYFAQRACKLVEEYFCATADESMDWWGKDYGFPDECQPWALLCDKVGAAVLVAPTCEELIGRAADQGWTVSCSDCAALRGACAGTARAGALARVCRCPEPNSMRIYVHLGDSPAYTGAYAMRRQARANNARAGCNILCNSGAVTGQLQCIIDQLKPAHVQAYYEVIS